jgi:hypothetical protein
MHIKGFQQAVRNMYVCISLKAVRTKPLQQVMAAISTLDNVAIILINVKTLLK